MSTDLYIQWSELVGLVTLVSVVRRSEVTGTRSLLMDTATGPRFSSIPNQFWCSETGRNIFGFASIIRNNLGLQLQKFQFIKEELIIMIMIAASGLQYGDCLVGGD